MGNSLQDQFLKLGLIDKKKAGKVKKGQHKHRKNKTSDSEVQVSKKLAQKKITERKDYTRILNQQKEELFQAKELDNQIHQLAQANKVEQPGEIAYKFTDNNKIRKLYTSQELINKLSSGQLGIVTSRGKYVIVPATIAEKIRALDSTAITTLHPRRSQKDSADDPYSEYEVPDDLVW